MGDRLWHIGPEPGEGPLSEQELKARARAGGIAPDTPLRLDGTERWFPARKVQGLLPGTGTSTTIKPTTTRIGLPDLESGDDPRPATSRVVLPDLAPVPAAPTAAALGASLGVPAGGPLFRDLPEPIADQASPPPPSGTGVFRPSTRSLPRSEAGLPPPPPRSIPLAMPRWRDLWPLAVLILGLGWIGGGILGADRGYKAGNESIVFLLALGSLPAAVVAFLYWLRPRHAPIGTGIGCAAFTGIAGVLLLLGLQTAANVTAGSRVRVYGRAGIIFFLLSLIGWAYALTWSESIGARWVGFVFGVGLCEEMVKLLPLAFLLHRAVHRHLGLHGFMFLGYASGLGFGITEALYQYNPWNEMTGAGDNLIRWLAVVPTHGLYTAGCASVLWKMSDHLTTAESWLGKVFVIALASLGMALIHGTYNTLCSLGTTVAIIMDGVSLILLCWWTRSCTENETDPAESPADDHATAWCQPKVLGTTLGAASLVLLLGLVVTTDAISAARSHVAPAYAAFFDGRRLACVEDAACPLEIHIRYDDDYGILVGSLRNAGDHDIEDLVVTIRTADGEDGNQVQRSRLPMGTDSAIDVQDEWFFDPGESIAARWRDQDGERHWVVAPQGIAQDR